MQNRVLIRTKTGNWRQVKDDFCEFFTSLSRKPSDVAGESRSGKATSTPSVTLEGFREYYRDVAVCEPYDTVFVPMIEVRGKSANGAGRGE